VLLQVDEISEITLQDFVVTTELLEPIAHDAPVVLVFNPEALQTFFQLMTMVEELDSLFEPNGYEEANTNRGDVDEKRPPGVDVFMGGVDIKHGR